MSRYLLITEADSARHKMLTSTKLMFDTPISTCRRDNTNELDRDVSAATSEQVEVEKTKRRRISNTQQLARNTSQEVIPHIAPTTVNRKHLGEGGGLQHRADYVHGHQNADQQHEQLAHQQRRVRDR
jgi:hypothetical protein